MSKAADRLAEKDPDGAAAIHRAVAKVADDRDSARKARDLETRLRRKRLVRELSLLAGTAVHQRDYGTAAALYATLAGLADPDTNRGRARRYAARAALARAELLRRQGKLPAALESAEEAARLGSRPGRRLAASLTRTLAARARAERLSRVRTALADGAPAHASRLLGEMGVPDETRRRIAALWRQQDIDRARAALQRGDAEAALAILDAADLVAHPDREGLVARALLDTGDVDGALARLSEAEAGRPETLLRAALALEAKGDETGAKSWWEKLRDLAISRAPLPSVDITLPKEPDPGK
jgi:tetratricopeptide (TPR) repeat protein